MRKVVSMLLFVAGAGLPGGLLPAQTKSDFSGNWKLNASKSDFGLMPAPDSITEKIVHQDPSLRVDYAQTGGTGDLTSNLVYTTDGKECVNHLGDNEFKSKLRWDDAELVAETTGSFDGNEFTAKDRWSLTDGGKSMTVARHVSADGADFDMKMVFDKQ